MSIVRQEEAGGTPKPGPLPRPNCGQASRMESMTPEGRLKPVWRVVCPCGVKARQWSVASEAAVRLWNRTVQATA
ncbi:MAG: hypothetical protein K6F46_02575 [Desulfovibrio sp.]|nr:hypothetical protein [Desulfovibrio sp.]